MSAQSRREYIRTQRFRYRSGRRGQKRQILDEGCRLFGMHRKSLIRALGREGQRRGRRRGRPRQYDAAMIGPLKTIWLAGEPVCGKRLKAMLPYWLPSYERRYGALDGERRAKLLSASASTLDRLLKAIRGRARKGLGTTRSVRQLEGRIPIRTNFREVDGPGTFEADTVAHCGQTTAGAFVYTLTLTDPQRQRLRGVHLERLDGERRCLEQEQPADSHAFVRDRKRPVVRHRSLRHRQWLGVHPL